MKIKCNFEYLLFSKVNLPLLQRELIFFSKIAKESGDCFVLHPDVINNHSFDPANLVISPTLETRISPHYNHFNSGKPTGPQSAVINFNNQQSINDQIYIKENGKRKSPEYIHNDHHQLQKQQNNPLIINDLSFGPPPSKRNALSPIRLHSNTQNLSNSNNSHLIVPNAPIISPIASPHSINTTAFGTNHLEDMAVLKELREKEKNFNTCKLQILFKFF